MAPPVFKEKLRRAAPHYHAQGLAAQQVARAAATFLPFFANSRRPPFVSV
jgi:hypothetical protein